MAVALAVWSGPSLALELEPGEPLRLIGEAQDAPEGAPRRFVIDARVTAGDEPFQSRIEGWFASLDPPEAGSGEISGTCAGERCALSVSLQAGEYGLLGDLVDPAAPARGQAALKPHFEAAAGPPVAVAFSAFGETAPGLGRLAPRDAIGSHELSDLLAWVGVDLGFSNLDDEEPDERERAGLAQWQAQAGRPASGLLLVEDLAALKAEAEAARKAVGWTAAPGAGWSAGYPAALLKPEGERRFRSADGKAELVFAIDPPVSDDDWDALVDRETEDRDDIESRSYTRVNDDMDLAYTAAGQRHVRVFARRDGGLARLMFRYPDGDEGWAKLEPVLLRTFRVSEDFRAP